jgi:hypothetical protein
MTHSNSRMTVNGTKMASDSTMTRFAKQEAIGDGSMDRELLTMLSYPLVRSSR